MKIEKPRRSIPLRNNYHFKLELMNTAPDEDTVRAMVYGYPHPGHPAEVQRDIDGGNKILMEFVSLYTARHGTKAELQNIEAWLKAVDPQSRKTLFTIINERNYRKPAIMLSSRGMQKIIASLEGREESARELTHQELEAEIKSGYLLRQKERTGAEV